MRIVRRKWTADWPGDDQVNSHPGRLPLRSVPSLSAPLSFLFFSFSRYLCSRSWNLFCFRCTCASVDWDSDCPFTAVGRGFCCCCCCFFFSPARRDLFGPRRSVACPRPMPQLLSLLSSLLSWRAAVCSDRRRFYWRRTPTCITQSRKTRFCTSPKPGNNTLLCRSVRTDSRMKEDSENLPVSLQPTKKMSPIHCHKSFQPLL